MASSRPSNKTRHTQEQRSRSFVLGLHAFTLPLVIEAIKEVGPPTAIAMVPHQDQRGPLLVTLATELACVVVAMLHEHLAYGGCVEESERELQLKVGAGYANARQKLHALLKEEEIALKHVREIERLILRLAAGEIVDRSIGNDVSPCPDGGGLKWTEHPACTPERRAHYERLSLECSAIREKIKETNAILAKAKDGVSNSVAPQSDDKQPAVNLDFSAQYEALRGGAAAILLQADGKWWSQWSRKIEKDVARIFPNRGTLAMLRDPSLQRIAEIENSFGLMSYNGISTDLLAEPNKLPKKCSEFLSRYEQLYQGFLDGCIPAARGCKEEQEELLAEAIRVDTAESRKLQQKLCVFISNISKLKGSELLAAGPANNLKWPAHTIHKGKQKKGQALSVSAMSEFRRQLSTQDQMVEAWLNQHGGDHHPCWWGKLRASKLIHTGKKPQHKRIPVPPKRDTDNDHYPSERAKNELYFCLSQRRVEFTPMFSRSFGAERWNAWLDEACRAEPLYWRFVNQ